MRPNIVAHKEEGDKRGEAAGDLFGVELFQQSAVGDVGGDDGGQLRAQTVVQQAVKGADEESPCKSICTTVCSLCSAISANNSLFQNKPFDSILTNE